MVSGKPPRHSKSTADPVTIDLDAKDVTDVSKGGEPTTPDAPDAAPSSGTAPVTGPAISEQMNDTAKKNENPKPIWDQPVKAPIEPEPNVGKTEDVKPGTTTAASAGPEKLSATVPLKTTTPDEKADPFKSDAAKAASPKPEPSKAQTSAPPSSARSSATAGATAASKPNDTKSAGSSGVIAAGIVGGLIALLAAGSMQYAGYLPPFSSAGGASSDELNALKSQVASLQQKVATAPQAADDRSALEQRLATLESSTSSSGDLSGKVTQLESAITSLQSERAAQDEKTAELTRRLSDAETKINEPRDDIEVARAIASAGLKAAIDRGGPFLTELDTLSRVTPDDQTIQSLRPFANTGVPSRAELTRNFPDIANAMLDSLRQSDPNQSIVDRLTESAMSLVKVRPVGNVEGEGPESKIARMEDKLRNGDLKGAALEWDGLPEPAKAVSADYKKSLEARIQVEDLVNSTLTRAITTTGQQG